MATARGTAASTCTSQHGSRAGDEACTGLRSGGFAGCRQQASAARTQPWEAHPAPSPPGLCSQITDSKSRSRRRSLLQQAAGEGEYGGTQARRGREGVRRTLCGTWCSLPRGTPESSTALRGHLDQPPLQPIKPPSRLPHAPSSSSSDAGGSQGVDEAPACSKLQKQGGNFTANLGAAPLPAHWQPLTQIPAPAPGSHLPPTRHSSSARSRPPGGGGNVPSTQT